MDEGDRDDRAVPGGEPAFLRLVDSGATVLVEVDADGYAVREVVLAADGRPRRAASGPEMTDYAGDYAIPTLRPGTPEFELHFDGHWARITAQEFDAAYRQAELHPLGFRELPRADQRRQLVGCLVITVVLSAGLVIVLLAMVIALELLGVVARNLFGLPF